eukprot:571155-Hanusia_phi.AAC.1
MCIRDRSVRSDPERRTRPSFDHCTSLDKAEPRLEYRTVGSDSGSWPGAAMDAAAPPGGPGVT